MRSFIFTEYGEPAEVLRLATAEDPPDPKPDELVIRVTQRVIHPADLNRVRGRFAAPLPPGGFPLGVDGTGVVDAVGSGSQFSVGDRVAFFPGAGAWGDRVSTRAEFAIRLPGDASDDVVCQLPANTITALRILRAAERAAPGQAGRDTPLLLTAAGSIVARILTIVARQRGLDVISVVRSRPGADVLSAYFPDLPVITTADADWAEQVRQTAGGDGLDVVIDPVGGALTADLLGLVRDAGIVLFYGSLADEPLPIRSIALAHRELTLRGVSASRWLPTSTYDERRADLATAIEIARGAGAIPRRRQVRYRRLPRGDRGVRAASARWRRNPHIRALNSVGDAAQGNH